MNLKIVHCNDRLRDDVVAHLEDALIRARAGEIEGFALVLLTNTVETVGSFNDRLRMLGALQMAIHRTTETEESL